MPSTPKAKSKDTSEASHFEPSRVFQYKIQHAFRLSELESSVNDLVALGWIPSGGIVFVPQSKPGVDGPLHGFYQPLVKEG